MFFYIRHYLVVFLAAALSLAAAALKDEKNQAEEKKTTEHTAHLPPAYQMGHGLMEGDMPVEYNARGRIDLEQGWNVWTEASFIFWQAVEGNLDLARSWILDNPDYPKNQRYYEMKFDFKPGFKIAAGSSFGQGYDGWDLQARYTWLHLENKKTYDIHEYVFIPFMWRHNEYGTVIQTSADWKLDLDMLDWELGRSFYAGAKLILHPFLGAKGGWLDQKFDENIIASYSPVGKYEPYYYGKIDTWKAGGRAGLDMSWFVMKELFISANLTASLLYSHWKASFDQYNWDSGYHTFTGLQKGALVQPVIESFLGVNWGEYFYKSRLHYNVSFLYEFQVFFKEKNFIVDQTSGQGADHHNQHGLYLHGVSLNARCDF